MCGIYLSISKGTPVEPTPEHVERLRARGPHSIKTTSTTLICAGERYHVLAVSTVLSLRGEFNDAVQPLATMHAETDARSLLCWNGEAYLLGNVPVVGQDTAYIFDALLSACRQDAAQASGSPKANCANVLRSINGPFACVFIDGLNGRLFFGRDCLGRRSLLMRRVDDVLELASVAGPSTSDWKEVDVDSHSDEPLMLALSLRNDFPAATHKSLVTKALASHEFTRLVEGSLAVQRLEDELRRSITLRTKALKSAIDGVAPTERPRIGVLFSGGIDCSLIARIIHDVLPHGESIDLLNVAFENPRIHSTQDFISKGIHFSASCPDRQTALSSYSELRVLCPERQWRLVRINIPYEETEAHRETITSLMAPHNTEMDLSIATALYFAARGKGSVDEGAGLVPYETSARVLFSGLGADELFGGYARHEQAYKRGGYSSLIEELQLDVSRLGKRNLGRDDRVLSHWGRETRFPYLDERLVEWAVQLPIWEKVGFGMQASQDASEAPSDLEEGKLVLRLVAQKLGLRGAAREKKRAIQFGARTAKMHSGRSRGTDSITG